MSWQSTTRRLDEAAEEAGALNERCSYGAALILLEPLASRAWELEHVRLLRELGRAEANVPAAEKRVLGLAHLEGALRLCLGGGQSERAGWIAGDLVSAYDGAGRPHGVREAYLKAQRIARGRGDRPLQARLERFCCIVEPPPVVATRLVQFVADLEASSREPRLAQERTLALQNLGNALLWLSHNPEARRCFEECAKRLAATQAGGEELPLNSLGALALVENRLDDAHRHLAGAAAVADINPLSALFIQTNRAILRAREKDLDGAITELEELARKADATGDLGYRHRVRWNLARALLLAERPQEALQALLCCPAHHGPDAELIRARRAGLLCEIYDALSVAVPEELSAAARPLGRSALPQARLYREKWDVCDLEFW